MHRHHGLSLVGLLFCLLFCFFCPRFLSPASAADVRPERLTQIETSIANGELELIPLMITGDKRLTADAIAMQGKAVTDGSAFEKLLKII